MSSEESAAATFHEVQVKKFSKPQLLQLHYVYTIYSIKFCLLKISKENFSTWCWCQRNSNYLPIHKRVVSVDVASCGHCKHIFSVPFFANKLCTSMMGLATIIQSDVKKKLCSQAWSNYLVLQDLLVIFGT